MQALNGLMLTYPVHQAADILFCRATLVPVGADQLPHIEQARVIARRFNRRYAPERPVFVEPEALLSEAPALLGTDGQKMSKSRNNTIATRSDGRRDRASDPGRQDRHRPPHHLRARHPSRDLQPLAAHRTLPGRGPGGVAEEIGSRGAAALKRRATEAINERLRPIRTARAELIADRAYLRQVLLDGSAAAAAIAERTLEAVSAAMHTAY